ncbi:MAG: DUF2784 domain-containing protein [Candidatus Auribacterota bacterium]
MTADCIAVIHALWIVFMITGGILTLHALVTRHKGYLRWRFFRTLHVIGIVFVSILAGLQYYCPLTILENYFRGLSGAGEFGNFFISHYLNKFIYPDIPVYMITGATISLAVFSVVTYIIFPPKRDD